VIFWLIAGGMACFVAVILYTGQIWIRGKLLADRRDRPQYFWLCVVVLSLGSLIAAVQAVLPHP
jgi:hypothetical protein